MNQTYTAAIIGAGRIGAGFDGPFSRHVLTYAHAFRRHPQIKLVGFVESDPERAARESKRWKAPCYTRIEELCANGTPNILVIATPDETHESYLLQALDLKPKLIICEKPIAQRLEGAERLRAKLRESGIPVIVNFSRRFDPTVRRIRQELLDGVHGAVIGASHIYVRGTIHNGSHIVDLGRFLFGALRMHDTRFHVDDFSAADPTVGGLLSFERCERFYLIPGDGRSYSMGEFDILTEKGRIRFSDSGQQITIQHAVDDPVWKGFRALSRPVTKRTELLKSMTYLVRHAVSVLDGSAQPESDAFQALETNEICIALVESLKER